MPNGIKRRYYVKCGQINGIKRKYYVKCGQIIKDCPFLECIYTSTLEPTIVLGN